MIEVTINFPSVEAAIVALDRLRAAPAKKDESKPASPAAPSTPAAARTPRVEARPKRKYTKKAAGGSPVGSTVAPATPGAQAPAAPKNATAKATAGKADTDGNRGNAVPDTGKAADEAANRVSTPADAPEAGKPADTIAVATEDEAKKAMEALYDKFGISVARDTLSRFGVNRVGELKPDARADFIAKAKAVIGGEAV